MGTIILTTAHLCNAIPDQPQTGESAPKTSLSSCVSSNTNAATDLTKSNADLNASI